MTYAEQLQHPLWQKKRLEILERDKFTCQLCFDTETQLHIHHKEYDKTYTKMAWEYQNYNYKTLCKDCHKAITEHISEYGNDKEFNTMKVKTMYGKALFIYSNGFLLIKYGNNEEFIMSEDASIKAVQFLINNWLKNG